MEKPWNRPRRTARELREHYRQAFAAFDARELRAALADSMQKLMDGEITARQKPRP